MIHSLSLSRCVGQINIIFPHLPDSVGIVYHELMTAPPSHLGSDNSITS